MSTKTDSKELSGKPKKPNKTSVKQTTKKPPKVGEEVKTDGNSNPKVEMSTKANSKELSGKPKKENKTSVKPTTKKPPKVVEEEEETIECSELERHNKFVLELKWCIDQLQAQVLLLKSKQKQAAEASRTLKVLSNPNAHLIKKRQLMRATFGDYRQKMKQDELKFNKDMKKISVSTVKTSHQKGTFLKKSDTSKKHDHVDCLSFKNSCNISEDAKPGFSFKKSDNSFKFNFSIENRESQD